MDKVSDGRERLRADFEAGRGSVSGDVWCHDPVKQVPWSDVTRVALTFATAEAVETEKHGPFWVA